MLSIILGLFLAALGVESLRSGLVWVSTWFSRTVTILSGRAVSLFSISLILTGLSVAASFFVGQFKYLYFVFGSASLILLCYIGCADALAGRTPSKRRRWGVESKEVDKKSLYLNSKNK